MLSLAMAGCAGLPRSEPLSDSDRLQARAHERAAADHLAFAAGLSSLDDAAWLAERNRVEADAQRNSAAGMRLHVALLLASRPAPLGDPEAASNLLSTLTGDSAAPLAVQQMATLRLSELNAREALRLQLEARQQAKQAQLASRLAELNKQLQQDRQALQAAQAKLRAIADIERQMNAKP